MTKEREIKYAEFIMNAMQEGIIEFDRGISKLATFNQALALDISKNGFLETTIQEYLNEYYPQETDSQEPNSYENYLEFVITKRTERINMLENEVIDLQNEIIELENQILALIKKGDSHE